MGTQSLISIIYLVSAGVLFLLAVIILKENIRSLANRVTAGMLFFAGLAPFGAGFFRLVLSETPELPVSTLNIFYTWELFFPCLLYFAAIFPNPLPIYTRHKRILQIAFLPHLFHVILVTLFSDPERIIDLLEFNSSLPIWGQILGFASALLKTLAALIGFLLLFHARFFSLINLAYVSLAIYLLYQGYKNVTNAALRAQVKVVIWGIVVGVGLYTTSIIVPTIFAWHFPPGLRESFVLSGLLAGPGLIAWAVVKYRFMDIGLIARQGLVYTISTAIVVGGYLLVISQLSTAFTSALGIESRAFDILIVVVLLLFFQPLYNQVDDFVRRIFIRSRSDYRYLMEELSRRLIAVFDTTRLVEIIKDALCQQMFVEKVHLALRQKDSGRFTISGVGDFAIEEKLLRAFLQRQRPLTAGDLEDLTSQGGLGDRLIGLGGVLLVPLVDKGELLGVISLSAKVAGFRYTYEDYSLLQVIANQVVVALNNIDLYAQSLEKQRLEEELEVARRIQINLLPRNVPQLADIELAAVNLPSRQVGGDYYDFLGFPDGCLGLVVADVSGKGVPAALLMARVQAIIQSHQGSDLPLEKIVARLNNFLVESGSPDRFVTMFVAELDPQSKALRYCNAGHNYPFVIRPDNTIVLLQEGGLILGAFKESVYQTDLIQLTRGDVLVIYTDGLSEARSPSDEEFGEGRLIEVAIEARERSASEICAHLISSARQFAAGAEEIDDMTLMVVKLK